MGVSNEGLWQEALAASEDALHQIERLAQTTADVAAKAKLAVLANLADALLTELEGVHAGLTVDP